MTANEYDVAIIGGGPGGSTTAALLRKYHDARVIVLERETFPREHVGESQLPAISAILHEMGVWDDVERAGFPVKVGATLRWGHTPELWDVDFVPHGRLDERARPGRFTGQRRHTAFQVERDRYDDILLRHAATLGAEVRQRSNVREVRRDGDRVTALALDDGTEIRARWYVDASGSTGVVRRAMGVAVDYPTALKNIAVWDYWDDPRWAQTDAIAGTRIEVLSLGYGWIWFILVGGTRASVGLVVPAEYYKRSGKQIDELYAAALASDARVRTLLGDAKQRGPTRSIKDWSFVSERATGENWFLVGEALGFADPILSAGMSLAHSGGRELAHTLAALLRGEHEHEWLATHYDRTQRARVRQHIRFADFWYASNGQFTDLKEHCRAIARDAGLRLSPLEAWQWLAFGGFTNDVPGQAMVGYYDFASLKGVSQRIFGEPAAWNLSKVNHLELALEGATMHDVPVYRDGKVLPLRAFDRDGKRLHMVGPIGVATKLVPRHPGTVALLEAVTAELVPHAGAEAAARYHAAQALELLVDEGWVRGSVVPGQPFVQLAVPREGRLMHSHSD